MLEKKIEDLSRQLTYEKQQHRKERQQVAKLQRELARAKSDSQKGLSVSTNTDKRNPDSITKNRGISISESQHISQNA